MIQKGGIGHNSVKDPPKVSNDGTRAHVKHNNLSGHTASSSAKNRFNQKAKKQLITHKHHSGGTSHLNHVARLHRAAKTFHGSTAKTRPQSHNKINSGIGLVTKGGSKKTLRKKYKNRKTHKKPKYGKKSMKHRRKH